MKSEVPCSIPWIFPFVGHGDDVFIIQRFPLMIAPHLTPFRRCYLSFITIQPGRDIYVEILLAPQHACKCLSLYIEAFFICCLGIGAVKLIRLTDALVK